MRERLLIQTETPLTFTLTTLTRSGATATATTNKAHGYATGDYVTIAGAVQSAYNGKVKITVTSTTTFTFAVTGSPATPATGAVTVVYVSDAQGGRRQTWTDVDTIFAELIPLRALERLQVKAIQGQVEYRFRVRVRTDLTPKMRALWTQRWPPGVAQKTLQIHGVLPDSDGRFYQLLEMGEVA